MILLAGGIGSGKSCVARILRLMGYGVFDCDTEARILMESDAALVNQLKEMAGDDIYSPIGKLDRSLLAKRIFNKSTLRERVNGVVHKAVKRRIAEWMEDAGQNIFVETAIPATSGLTEMADSVWLVVADKDICKKRALARDGRPEEEVERIMKIQSEEEFLIKVSGIPVMKIPNNPEDSLLSCVNRLLNEIEIN